MRREDAAKLIGGYATGTLSESERRALFEAALSDQELFEALASEQALKDVLDDPRSRREVAEALEERPRAIAWWRLVGALAATAVLAVVVIRVGVPERTPQIAMVRQVAPPPAAAPAPVAPQPQQSARLMDPRAMPAAPKRERKDEVLPPPPALGAEQKLDRPMLPQAELADRTAPPPAPATPPPAERAGASAPSGVVGGIVPAPGPAQAFAAAEKRTVSEAFSVAADTARAGALCPVRYTVLQRAPDGAYIIFDPASTVLDRDARVRLRIEPVEAGQVSVISGARLLYTTAAQPGRTYSFDPPPTANYLTLMFAPPATADAAKRRLAPTGLVQPVRATPPSVKVDIRLNRR